MLSGIACIAKNGVIGQAGKLPWKIQEDFSFFRAKTRGHAIIMGSKTFLSLDKTLEGRLNIVLTRQKNFSAPLDVIIANSPNEALQKALSFDKDPFVIGGSEIFTIFSSQIERFFLTRLNEDYEGDIFFPKKFFEKGWQLKTKEPFSKGTFETWEKIA